MGSISGTSEIIELKEDSDSVNHSRGLNSSSFKSRADNRDGKDLLLKPERYSVEADINKLIEAIDLRTLPRGVGSPRKNPQKRPIRVGTMQASGIGISESVTLKQALRGLCISQASEMAAIKRSSKPAGLPRTSEAGTIKRLYSAVVVESGETGLPHSEEIGSLVEISIVPEKDTTSSPGKATKSLKIPMKESVNGSTVSSPHAVATTAKLMDTKTSSQDIIALTPSDVVCETSTSEPGMEEMLTSESSASISNTGFEVSISGASKQAIKPDCKKMNCTKKKGEQDTTAFSGTSNDCTEVHMVVPGTTPNTQGCQTDECTQKNAGKESITPASSSTKHNAGVNSKNVNFASKPAISSNSCNGERTYSVETSETSRSKDKGECSQSSKSSIGEYSSSTSISEESSMSGSSFHGNRPHMSKDSRWEAIHHIEKQHGNLGLKHFKLLRRLGCGDIGTVYLADLSGIGCLFALKVMDNDFLASRKKLPRAQTEREILQMLDHPFLPTLYTHFTTNRLSCLVMEYCPGGDLHVLRQRQPGKSFSEQAARFYAAEVLLALEYLHMLGVVYRDLKPENILVREDGHIMLSDFDLSLRCTVSPTLLKLPPPSGEPTKRLSGPCADSNCIDPLCLQPSWVHMPCFTPRLISTAAKTRKLKSDLASQVSPLPQLVAEPTSARSNSFVGTHEYLAPEIIKGEGHGSAVDWWTFGIFLYELLFGRTPFKGSGNEDTLANVVTRSLKFPERPSVSFPARDLIRGLLKKEPENRLGSVRGATEIKQHLFFEGLNWALIRCTMPPEMPKISDIVSLGGMCQKKESKCLMLETNAEDLEFELF